MATWFFPLVLGVAGLIGMRIWYRRWRAERTAARRVVEGPNSHYSSKGVRNQEDRERWGAICLAGLHPLNEEEVRRLLEVVDRDGPKAISPTDRTFLDNMTIPRRG